MGSPPGQRAATDVAALPARGTADLSSHLSLERAVATKSGGRMNADPAWYEVRRTSRAKWLVPAAFTLVALVLLAAGLLANVSRKSDFGPIGPTVHSTLPQPQSAVAPVNLVKPLTPEEAVKENGERP